MRSREARVDREPRPSYFDIFYVCTNSFVLLPSFCLNMKRRQVCMDTIARPILYWSRCSCPSRPHSVTPACRHTCHTHRSNSQSPRYALHHSPLPFLSLQRRRVPNIRPESHHLVQRVPAAYGLTREGVGQGDTETACWGGRGGPGDEVGEEGIEMPPEDVQGREDFGAHFNAGRQFSVTGRKDKRGHTSSAWRAR